LDSNFNQQNKLLSGTFIWNNSNGSLNEKKIYKNGLLIYYEAAEDYKNYPSSSFFIYYDSLWNNTPNTHFSNLIQEKDTTINYYHYNTDRWHYHLVNDTINCIQKYPYFKVTPPLLGFIIGYDFLQTKQVEFGFILNFGGNYGFKRGVMSGPSVTYKKNLYSNINSIDLDIGIYSPIVLGLGINSNFNTTDHLLGFRPFIGTSFYHMQLTYGYNFFRNSKNEVLDINHHTVQFKLAIPVKRLKNL